MSRPCSRLASIVALAVLVSAAPARLLADENTKAIYRQTLRATCWVVVPDVGSGTGWVVDAEKKLVVTNHHVVLNADRVLVLLPTYKNGKLVSEKSAYKDDRGVRAKVIDTDVARDLAILQIIDPLPEGPGEVKLAADSADPSDRVHSVGNPGASDALWVYTSGTVRQVYQREWHHLDLGRRTKTFRQARIMETSSPINPGDSGGPVVNDKGELVGVVSSSTQRHGNQPVQLISLTIDVSEVKAFLAQTLRLLDPTTADAFILRGERLFERGLYAEAVADFTAALKLDGKNALAYRKRAWAFVCKGDQDTALADCTAAIRLDPEDAWAYHYRGLAHERKKQLDEALADYTRAIQLDARLSHAYNNRGIVYFLRKDFQRAAADFTRAIESDPNNAIAWANRGDTYFDLKEYDRTIADCTKALHLNPFLTYAWSARGFALREKGLKDEHVANFQAALEYDPRNAALHVSLGNAQTFKGNWKTAVDCYSKALQLDPSYPGAYFFRGSAYEELGMLSDAQPDYRKALDLNPGYKDRVKTHNRCYLQVDNQTGETLRIYVQYEYMTEEGNWVMYPNDPAKTYWKVEPGKRLQLLDDGWKIACRRCRIWAVGETSKQVWSRYKDQDWWLAPKEGYLAKSRIALTQTFTK